MQQCNELYRAPLFWQGAAKKFESTNNYTAPLRQIVYACGQFDNVTACTHSLVKITLMLALLMLSIEKHVSVVNVNWNTFLELVET
eukprot:743098-Pleurochrysis_carterae.AAC.1